MIKHLFVLILCFCSAGQAIELFLWQPSSDHAIFVLPKRDGETREQAVQNYIDTVRANPNIGSFPPKLTGESKIMDLPEKDFRARVLLLANKKNDHRGRGKRIFRYINLYKETLSYPFVLPVGARASLLESEKEDFLKALTDEFDGINALGGADVAPSHYGERVDGATGFNEERDMYEIEVIQAFTKDETPRMVIGQCRGCQITIVALGGSLIQHIPAEVKASINHRFGKHNIRISGAMDNELRVILGDIMEVMVNTYHHQAGDPEDIPDELRITAIAEDGVIEALQFKNGRGSIVQFHSELLPDHLRRRFFSYYTHKLRKESSIYTCERVFK